ncbi:hypothetical protein WJX84_002552 [Apatococcus fuscideae]|uniref:Phosphofructokinase domain-containing protein n=1 Tax=Apatococcus fuscideae TaxID=2026836 RepID=A0AAW1T7R0_9CHLO
MTHLLRHSPSVVCQQIGDRQQRQSVGKVTTSFFGCAAPARSALHLPVRPVQIKFTRRKTRQSTQCRSAPEDHPTGLPSDRSNPDPEDILVVKNIRHKLQARDSPFVSNNNSGGGFVGDNDLVLLNSVHYESESSSGAGCPHGVLDMKEGLCIPLPPWALRSGPRKTVYYNPEKVTAAIVTCGGLCPGLNDVIANIVTTLEDYGVPDDRIYGIRYGLRGFVHRDSKPMNLHRSLVDGIHLSGGTMLGTSRGGADIKSIVKRLDLWGVNMLLLIGGNGGNAAANAIQQGCEDQGWIAQWWACQKSIDNDILLIDRCFGFETAVEEAQKALMAAKGEGSDPVGGGERIALPGSNVGVPGSEGGGRGGRKELEGGGVEEGSEDGRAGVR